MATQKRPHTHVGQGELFLPEQPSAVGKPAVISGDRKRAFGWAIGTYNPLAEHTLTGEITESDLGLVESSALREALYKEGRYVINGLAVNDREYSLIPRNAKSIGSHASAKASQARTLDINPKRRQEAIDRASGHTLLSYANREGLMKWLNDEKGFLHQVRKPMTTPGFRGAMSEQDWLMATRRLVLIFENILRVAGVQNGWKEDIQERAQKAMLFRLYGAKQRQKVSYWRDMTDLAIEYNDRKIKLFDSKIRIARSLGEKSLTNGKPL